MTDVVSRVPSRYQVGDLMLDVGQRQVFRDGEELQLGGLTFDLLQVLAESAPNIVSHDELAEKVWSGRPVSPETITQRAMMLRQALGDQSEKPTYFEVVRGHGIRLIADVVKRDSHRPSTSIRSSVAMIAGILVAAVVAVFAFNHWDSDDQQGILPNSVAVLPFENLSPDSDDAYFAAGLHNEILNQLAKLQGLSVISRASVRRYADSDFSVPEIAAQLNVGTVMEGSVRYANDRVRITTQLIDARSGEYLWSETYDREFSNIFAIESDIATNIANVLAAEFSLGERQRIERPPTSSTAAYQLYLRAIALTGSSTAGVLIPQTTRVAAESFLDQALALDPQFAFVYARKSRMANVLDTESARLNAEKALEIDPDLGLAHLALAGVLIREWRRTDARLEYERALELSPGDPEILGSFAVFLAFVEEFDEARRLAENAITLNPYDFSSFDALAAVLQLSGDIDSAADAFRQSIALNASRFASLMNLARLEAGRGNQAEAVRLLQILEERFNGGSAFMAHGYALAGQRDKAIDIATRVRASDNNLGAGLDAVVSLILGERERALDALERLVEHRAPLTVGAMRTKYNVWPDPALSEPEITDILARISF